MLTADDTVLTERQVEVLTLREQGDTQQEIADRLGTTDANISAIERAARTNIEQARRTLRLADTLQAPIQFTVPAGERFDALVEAVYAHGDEADLKIAHCRPELYLSLYETLGGHTTKNQLEAPITVGLTADGDVSVHVGDTPQ